MSVDFAYVACTFFTSCQRKLQTLKTTHVLKSEMSCSSCNMITWLQDCKSTVAEVPKPRKDKTTKQINPTSLSCIKLEKAKTVYFKKSPCTEGGHKVQGSVDPRFAVSLPFPVPEILESKAFRNSGEIPAFFPEFSRNSIGNPRRDPEDSHSLLEFVGM